MESNSEIKFVHYKKSTTMYCASKRCRRELTVIPSGHAIEFNGELLGKEIECGPCGHGQYELVVMPTEAEAKKLADILGLTESATSLPLHAVYGLFSKEYLEPPSQTEQPSLPPPACLPLVHGLHQKTPSSCIIYKFPDAARRKKQ